MKTIRIGLVGSQFISSIHLEALCSVPGAEVIAVTSATEAHAKAFSERHGIKQHFTDFRKMYEMPEVDLVVRREGGFAGPIDLTADGLPDGVRIEPARVAEGQLRIKLAVVAKDEEGTADATALLAEGDGVLLGNPEGLFRLEHGRAHLALEVLAGALADVALDREPQVVLVEQLTFDGLRGNVVSNALRVGLPLRE